MAMIHIASGDAASIATNVDNVMVSPNAIDLRLKKIYHVNPDVFIIDEDKKTHRTTSELELSSDGYYTLVPGSYEFITDSEVNIAEGEAGWVVPRSTLNRNGVFITSGLYDSGYKGIVAGAIHVNCGPMKVKPGTRIAQFLLFSAQSLSQYDGDYGNDKTHDEKYK